MDEQTNRAPKPATNVVPIRREIEVGGVHLTDFLTLVVFSLLDEASDDEPEGD